MNYRNRGPRCEHGFCREVVRCPVCDVPPTGYHDKYYVPSVGSPKVLPQGRFGGRDRGRSTHGYGESIRQQRVSR